MAQERTYLSLDKDLKATLKTIQEKEGFATFNDFIVSILEDYIINSDVKFKYQDHLTKTIQTEISQVNKNITGIYELLQQITE